MLQGCCSMSAATTTQYYASTSISEETLMKSLCDASMVDDLSKVSAQPLPFTNTPSFCNSTQTSDSSDPYLLRKRVHSNWTAWVAIQCARSRVVLSMQRVGIDLVKGPFPLLNSIKIHCEVQMDWIIRLPHYAFLLQKLTWILETKYDSGSKSEDKFKAVAWFLIFIG